MDRVELAAEFCLLVRIPRRRAFYLRNRRRHFRIHALPFPRPFLRGITVRSAVRRTDRTAVVCCFVVVAVTGAARTDRLSIEISITAAVFLMADGARDAGFLVSLRVCRVEFGSLMTFYTRVLDRLIRCVTGCA